MSPTSVSSATKATLKPSHKSPWKATDGLLAVALSLVIPVVIALVIVALYRIGIVPRVVQDLVLGNGVWAEVVQYVIALIIEILLITNFVRLRRTNLRSLGWKSVKWWWFIIAIFSYALLLGLVSIATVVVETVWPHVDLNQAQDVFEFGRSSLAMGLSFVTSVVVAPFVEETLFRGLLFTSLRTRLPVIVSAVITSLIFGFLHGQLDVGIYTFLLSLILCWMYQKNGSLYPGILLHFFNNIVAFWALSGHK